MMVVRNRHSVKRATSVRCLGLLATWLIIRLFLTMVVDSSNGGDETNNKSINNKFPEALKNNGTNVDGTTTILAYGALLSEASSRLTFPQLTNFRFVRVRGLRRVFGHPHMFLISQNIVDPSDPALRIASLSAEEEIHDVVSSSSNQHPPSTFGGFVVAAFDVMLDDEQRAAFVERERSYRIATVPYYDLDSSIIDNTNNVDAVARNLPAGQGVICLAGTDDAHLPSELKPTIDHLKSIGRSVWHWPYNSGLLPADIYLRHCLLSVKKAGPIAEKSFLEETFLADRTTSLAEYLAKDGVKERVMSARPPEALMARFNG